VLNAATKQEKLYAMISLANGFQDESKPFVKSVDRAMIIKNRRRRVLELDCDVKQKRVRDQADIRCSDVLTKLKDTRPVMGTIKSPSKISARPKIYNR
jgi:hypothetical protein